MTAALDRSRAARAALAFALAAALVVAAAPAAEGIGRLVSLVVVGSDAAAAADAVRTHGGEVRETLPIIDGVWARVPESRISDLATRALVYADRPMHVRSDSFGGEVLASAYPREVGADRLWSDGETGAGVTVALVDTGIADVPDVAGRVVARANFTRDRSYFDSYGHGTFQAGLIAGDGSSSDGRYVGVAPGASLMSVKVAGADGSTSLGQVLAGIQLVDFSAERFNVRVMLLALDSGSGLPPELDPLSWALRRAWSHGIVVVVPAGNDGPDGGTIGSPGNDPVLLTAGSVDDHGTPAVSDDSVSDFSSRGPTQWDDQKPEVAAPGEHLIGLRAPGSTVDEQNPTGRVEDAYFRGSGTSMSAAVTAGAAALLLSARPDLTATQAKALLMATAEPFGDADPDAIGAGVVDAADAVALPETPELPAVPDMGEAEAPFGPKGLDFGWHTTDDGTQLWLARTWLSRTWNARTWTDDEWDARQWMARTWAARTWMSRTWNDDEWAARTWLARTWLDQDWAARTWAGRTWLSRTWTSRTWTDAEWDAWTARSWTSRTWNAEAWESRTWNSRTWNARTWNARTWNSRSWNSRTWSDEDWDSRTWSDEDWESRSWNSRTWTSRTWTSRTWTSRTWSSRTWSSRSWTTTSWG